MKISDEERDWLGKNLTKDNYKLFLLMITCSRLDLPPCPYTLCIQDDDSEPQLSWKEAIK